MKLLSLLYFLFLIITGVGCLVSYSMIANHSGIITPNISPFGDIGSAGSGGGGVVPASLIPMSYLTDLNTVKNTYYNGIAIAILFGIYILATAVLYRVSYARYGDINTILKLVVSCILIGFSVWLFYGSTLFFINYTDDKPYLQMVDNLCPVMIATNALCLFTAAFVLFCLIVEYSGFHKFYPYHYAISAHSHVSHSPVMKHRKPAYKPRSDYKKQSHK